MTEPYRNIDPAPLCRVRFRHPHPGFFLNDARVVLRLDDRIIYDGSFLKGIDLTVELSPGSHHLETAIHLGPIARTKHFALEVPPEDPQRENPLEVTLHYSRFWGNFSSKLQLHRPPKLVGG